MVLKVFWLFQHGKIIKIEIFKVLIKERSSEYKMEINLHLLCFIWRKLLGIRKALPNVMMLSVHKQILYLKSKLSIWNSWRSALAALDNIKLGHSNNQSAESTRGFRSKLTTMIADQTCQLLIYWRSVPALSLIVFTINIPSFDITTFRYSPRLSGCVDGKSIIISNNNWVGIKQYQTIIEFCRFTTEYNTFMKIIGVPIVI